MSFFTCLRAGLCACLVASATAAWSSDTSSGVQSPPVGNVTNLSQFINRILDRNPEIQAAQAAIDAARARVQGADLPIYNPELELEGAKTAHTDFYDVGVGLSQTIDIHDKRGAQEQVIQAELEATRSALSALRQTKAVALLDAMVRILNSSEITLLAKQRFQLLERFQALAEQRHSAGDIPLIKVKLTRLAVAEAAMAHAQAGGELVEAKGDFFTLAGEPAPKELHLPATLPAHLPDQSSEQLASTHPSVRQVHLLALAARVQINASDRTRKADPTLGLMVGREDEANKLTLSFSMPLQVRNNFRSNVTIARSEALQAEQEAQQVYRATLAQLQTARERYTLVSRAWHVWVSRGQSSLKKQSQLLEQLWQAGELETTEYLVQLQQMLDTRIAGAELHGAMWRAWIKWQAATGRVFEWISNPVISMPDVTATSTD